MEHPNFTPDAVMQAAREKTGLTNFGGEAFMPGLGAFIMACQQDGYISGAAFDTIAGRLTDILVSRLRFEAALTRNPEILDEVITSPLFIIGAGRVGSTKLHRLLAQARGVQTFPLWQVMNPVPWPGEVRGDPSPRIAATEQFCAQLKGAQPQLYAAIEPDAAAPDEDPYMFDMTFMQLMFLAIGNVPSYIEWIYRQDWQEHYLYYKKLLQYQQWQNGTSRIPMLLKGPSHTPHIDQIHRVFPDARFVHIHRDPVTCAASMGKVVWLLHMLQPVKGLDTLQDSTSMQQISIRYWLLESLRLRRQHPQIPVTDFYYEQIRDDAVLVARRILQFWGAPYLEDDFRRMAQWERSNQQHKLGKFQYSEGESGVDRLSYEASLAPYLERFFGRAYPSAAG